jgi:long-chain fatty acid transport protein
MNFKSNKTKRLVTTSILAVASGLFFAAQANAGGFYLQEQSVKANGRAWSGEAAESGVQQLWWNPAAIGGMTGKEAFFGTTVIQPTAKVNNIGTTVIRPTLLVGTTVVPTSTRAVGGVQSFENPIENGVLPTGGFAMALNDKVAIGVIMSSPFSVTTDYDPDSWTRYSADETYIRTFDIQPTVAFTPVTGLSLGVGLNIEYMEATLSNYIPSALSPLYADGHQELRGDGWDYGYTVGAQYHNDKFDFGLSYKSAIEHELEGSISIAGLTDPIAIAYGLNKTVDGATATFTLPWQASASVRYHATPKLTVQAQYTRFGWSEFDTISLTNMGSLGNSSLSFGYEDSTAVSIGLDYQYNDKLALRGGIQSDSSPIHDGHRDPRVPDSDRLTIAGGATYQLKDNLAINAALTLTSFDKVNIDKKTAAYAGTALQTVITTSGVLDNAKAVTFGVGAVMKF